jgi:asparagine synthase (glutamine-hydrolysing)
MEYPYIAILWTPDNASQTHHVAPLITRIQRDARWHPTLLRHGVALFTQKPPATFLDAYLLADKAGIILGTLFRQGGTCRLSPGDVSEDDEFADFCLRSRGTHLTKTCWGAYVALLSHPNTGTWSIARDCSGMIPCYYTTVRDITIAFSNIRDLDILSDTRDQDAPLLRFEVNWRYIAGFLASSQMQIRETGLKNFYELLAGEALESVAGRQTVRTLWDPMPIADYDPSTKIDIGDTCRALRETAQSCIVAWAGTADRILLSLSGGFDSSLVLTLLKVAPRQPKALCVNRFASGPGEDERGYARSAAMWTQADLVDLSWDSEAMVLDDNCLRFPRTAKPTLPHLFNGLDAPIYNKLGATHGCNTIWTGQGGDHLFMAVNTDLGLIDCVHHHGFLSSQMLTTLRDTATLTRKSVPHLIGHTIRRMISTGDLSSQAAFFTWTALLPQTRFLSKHVLTQDLSEYIRHPWTAPSVILPPGKRYQLLLLAEVLNRHRPLYGLQAAQEFHPLLSQPLIETCLRIPVYLLLTGGKTRGLARLAFEDCLPAKILNRQGKGQTTYFTLGMLRRSLPFITPLLLDGELVRHGLVNRNSLVPVLNAGTLNDWTVLFPLAACIATEVWLQGWMRCATADQRAASRLETTIH